MSTLEPTGERFNPAMRGLIRYEHLHRYALCMEIARNRDVLDLASGEGYGAALLATRAKRVVGVDADARAVEHARHLYYHPNLRFHAGLCTEIPTGDACFDLVVSFETIEHVDEQDRMLDEIRRVLRPGGRLIISSPNKLVYSDQANHSNPFHVRELYYDEFLELLERHFPYVRIHGQRVAAASFVYPLVERFAAGIPSFSANGNHASEGFSPLEDPVYFVAVCSDDESALGAIDSLFVDTNDDIFQALQVEFNRAAALIAQQQALSVRLPRTATGQHGELLQLTAAVDPDSQLEPAQDDPGSTSDLAAALRRSSEALAILEGQLATTVVEHARELLDLRRGHAAYVERAEADIALLRNVLSSYSWRLMAPLRKLAASIKAKR